MLLKNEFDDPASRRALADLPDEDDTPPCAPPIRWGPRLGAGARRQALQRLPPPHPANRLLLLAGVAEALVEHAQAEDDPLQAAQWRAEAVTWYEQVDPDDNERHVRAQQRLAVLDQRDGRIDDARARLGRIRAAADPDDAAFGDSYLLEAELLEQAGRAAEAVAVLSEGLEALPADVRLRYSRALAHERQDEVDAALADLRTLVELDPDNPMFLNALGYTLADRTERHEEALPLIQRALELDPKTPPPSTAWAGCCIGWAPGRGAALSEAASPASLMPKSAPTWARCCGRYERACARGGAAATADPDNRVLKATLERR